MNPHDLLSDFPLGPGDPLATLLTLKQFSRYLADHVYQSTIHSGERVGSDPTTTMIWLRELSDECRTKAAPGAPSLELRLEQIPRTPPAQVRCDPTCPDCIHVHEGRVIAGRQECGHYLGEGKFCPCESKVTA